MNDPFEEMHRKLGKFTIQAVLDAKSQMSRPARKTIIRYQDLLTHDMMHGDCVVRELEMVSDGAITAPGYTIQFWRDVNLYGVDEAILLVGKYGNGDKIAEGWAKIKERIREKALVSG